MNELKESEVAWLAGIYEGEGSCAITNGRAIRVEIVMTDQDVMTRIHALTGCGSLYSLPQRAENYKSAWRWSVGSGDAVAFLEAVMPWLGERRLQRAQEAVSNWRTNKKQSSASDEECVRGHRYDAPGNRRTKYGTCHLCHLENCRRSKAKKKANTL